MIESDRNAEKTSRKQSEARRTLKLLKRLTLGFRARLDEDLRPLGVTLAQLRVLHAIKSEATASGAQVARECSITPQTAHGLILRAEKNGWIVRQQDITNERRRIASLTATGEKLLQDTDVVVQKIEMDLWVGVKRSDLKAMNDLLEMAADRL